jgi:heme/copper-type cytochrome/quinol oxidase subunit 2
MDYLLLIEVFPLVALGLVLLVMATLLTHTFRKLIGWGSVAALILLSGGQILAVASGIASGAAPASGVNFVIINVSIILFNIWILALAILAIFLLKRIFTKKQEPTPEG